VAFRQVATDTAPLFHAAGERTPSQRSARWHRQAEGYAQYLALEPAGAWAELVRYERIRANARAQEYRRKLWMVIVDETEIADLAGFERYEQCRLDPRIAVGDHADAQTLADELRAAGYRGLLSPSAALPGATNLTLFGERYEKILLTDPGGWANPDPQLRLPCHLVAESGPPVELITSTCFIGMRHEAYRAHLRGSGRPEPPDAP
jgi:RES domain-containing protein